MRILLLTILFSTTLLAQAQDAKDLISHYFNDVRGGKFPSIPLPLGLPENAKTTLGLTIPYTKDTSAIVRAKAYAILRYVGTKSRQVHMRERVTMQLLQACRDKNSGNVGTALEYLTAFTTEDFTKASKDTLRNLYAANRPYFSNIIKLIGFLQLRDMSTSLQALVQDTKANKFDRWAARLALARMQDKAMITTIMERVRKQEVNDDLIYDIFPDLIYTRQPEAFAYLLEILNSDAKNCTSADAEANVRMSCAYRVMEQLAPVIEGYPLKLDQSGDIDTKDYVEALKTVRDWFKQHKDYKTLNNKY
jgi:hypothetical protein